MLEVLAFNEGALFHPKVWAIRFTDQDENRLHRLIVLSRNLTLDRSWDTALVLDEEDRRRDRRGTCGRVRSAPADIDASPTERRPAGRDRGPRSHTRPSPPCCAQPIHLRCASSNGDARRVLYGHFPTSQRLLAISPFLTKDAVGDISQIASDRTIVSRAESLELMGSKLLEGWDVNVLQRLAEVDPERRHGRRVRSYADGFLEAHTTGYTPRPLSSTSRAVTR